MTRPDPRWCAALLVVLAAVVLGIGGASAAQLRLTGAPSFSAEAATRCDDAVTVTPTGTGATTSVTVSGLAPACAGLPLHVQVWDTAASSATPAAFAASTTVPATGTTVTVGGTAAFTPTTAQRALVTMASWPLPTEWVPPVDAVTCTVTGVVRVVGTTRLVDPPSGQTCSAAMVGFTRPGGQPHVDLLLRVTTTSTANLQWAVTVDFAHPTVDVSPQSVNATPSATVTSTCAELPTARLAADAPLTDTLTAGDPRDLTVRGHRSATGGADLSCP